MMKFIDLKLMYLKK